MCGSIAIRAVLWAYRFLSYINLKIQIKMTPIEKQQEFYSKLKALLVEYKAEISLEETFKSYYTETKIVVDFDYDEFMAEQLETGIIPSLDLGKYERGN